MTSPSVRPWWKKKRSAAALALWLAVAYPLSVGPALYAAIRGWVPFGVYDAYARPALLGLHNPAGRAVGFWDSYEWWDDIARRHAASD